jgi:hypothetical protein
VITSCEAIHRLVPLYAEADLPARKQARVRQHLQGCQACTALLESYRTSQKWLRATGAPRTSGATLDQLRRAVWRRIDAQPPLSWTWRELERLWAGLRAWAARPSVAALAVVVVLMGSVALPRLSGLGGARIGPQADDLAGSDELAAGAGNLLLAQADLDDDGEPVGELQSDDRAAAVDPTMRIEIQTRDPDVRIIWFSPPEDRSGTLED